MGTVKGAELKMAEKRNEINNKELKENLANNAVNMLKEGEDYGELTGTTVDFGYLFEIEDHGLEALFKMTTDRMTCYFAAQKDSLIRIDTNEETFAGITKKFLEIHDVN